MKSIFHSALAKRSTSLFSNTRLFDGVPFDAPPLGARAVELQGSTVSRGFLFGTSPPEVLVLHGWGMDCSTMTTISSALSDYGALSFDAPGHGINPGHTSTLMAYTTTIESILSQFESMTTIVAHSLSSIAALAAIQRQHNNRIMQVIMLAPPASLNNVLERWAQEKSVSSNQVNLMRSELHKRNGVVVHYWDLVERSHGVTAKLSLFFDPEDTVVPHQDVEQIFSSGIRVESIAIADSGHLGITVHPQVLALIREAVGENVSTITPLRSNHVNR
ncbi:MAG: alpha/beta fold hydrolase [Mycobacteriaceae bacterium]